MGKYRVLKSPDLSCPNCSSSDELSRSESVLVSAHVQVKEDGTWEYTGSSKVHWDTQEYSKEEPEFYCNKCHSPFDAPWARYDDEDPKPHPEDKDKYHVIQVRYGTRVILSTTEDYSRAMILEDAYKKTKEGEISIVTDKQWKAML